MKKWKIKRGLAIFMSSILITQSGASAAFVFPSLESYAYTERTAVVNANSLNVRSGPGTTYTAVGRVTHGMNVTVIGERSASDGALWYQIRYTSGGSTTKTGYVLASYLRFETVHAADDASFEAYMTAQGFPESYKNALRGLHKKYPNWIFTAQHVNVDWETAVTKESAVGKNLVGTNSPSSWKSTETGAFDWGSNYWPGFDGATWVAASKEIIAYYMDPRNFLDEKYIFQFLLQSYNSSTQTQEGLKYMLKGSFMDEAYVPTGSGNTGTENPGGSTNSSGISQGPASLITGGNSGNGSTIIAPGTNSQPGGDTQNSGTTIQPGGSSQNSGTVVQPGGNSQNSGTATQSPGENAGNNSPGTPTQSDNQAAPGQEPSGPPSGTGDGDVRLQAPTASIVPKNAAKVMAPATGPGMNLGTGNGDNTTVIISPGSSSQSTNNGTLNSGAAASGSTDTAAGLADYASVIMKAAQQSGVNPYVLAAMILQEQGKGTSPLISGKYSKYPGYYNFFNVGAYQDGSMSAIERGLWYASQSGSYGRPWNSVEKSIVGGAQYYGASYVNVGQDTFYLKKFNVQGSNMYNHQYMKNVEGAAGEGANLSEAYSSDMRTLSLEFKIPVYRNMPDSAADKPVKDGNPNNKLSSLSVNGYSLTPTFNRDTLSYDLIVDPSVSQVGVVAKAIDSGATVTGAGTVNLSSGVNVITVTVKAKNGDVREYKIQVVRQEGAPNVNSSNDSQNNSGNSGNSGSVVSPGGQSQSGPASGPGALIDSSEKSNVIIISP